MLARPVSIRDNPKMPSDALSEILSLSTVESMVTGGFEAGGPWALRFPAPKSIKFFALTKGQCWAQIDGEAPVRFEQGDVGLLTAERPYTLSSDPSVTPVDAMALFSGRGRSFVTLGDGTDCHYVGGHVLLDPTSGTLLSEALPPWLRVDGATEQAARFRWLLGELVNERKQRLPGSALVASQLAQLLFVQILRAQMDSDGRIPPGWLRALGDPRLVPAVQLMHDEPARAWHLDELARACAMSRSTFGALHRDGRHRSARLSGALAHASGLQGVAGRGASRGIGGRFGRLFLARCFQQCLQADDRRFPFAVA